MTDGDAFAKQIEDLVADSHDVHTGLTYLDVQDMMHKKGVQPNDRTAFGARSKILQDALIPNFVVTASQREMLGESITALEGKPFVSAIESLRSVIIEP